MKTQWIIKHKLTLIGLIVVLIAIGLLASCDREGDTSGASGATESAGLSADASAIAEARGLTPDDVAAALKTYTPSGVHD